MVDVPPRDLTDLAVRFRRLAAAPTIQPERQEYATGDIANFWYIDHDTNQSRQIEAVLMYRSDQLNLWVESGADVNERRLQEAAAVIEEQILPTNRTFFGEEWRPGIDGDDRVNILHVQQLGEMIAGYFSEADEFVNAVNPFSNERELMYVNLAAVTIGEPDYFGLIAHEFLHMIHWRTDPNEVVWLEEGLGELAAFINGFGESDFVEVYTKRPDTQLNRFTYEGDEGGAHYGASFLFTAYFLDRFGEEATRMLVRHPQNGIGGVEQTVAELGEPLDFDTLFADWLVANYLDGHNRGEGVYQYQELDLPAIEAETTVRRVPVEQQTAVQQYGADFIQLAGDSPLTLVFTGTQQVPLLDAAPFSGRQFWSTYPADGSDMTLTRRFDLTGLVTATLQFQTWYEIESGWDYAYVVVSTDEGQSWQPLETISSTRYDPQGNSYGPGYSGVSGSGETPTWIPETVDLTPFAGGPILIRFEYITDDALHLQGFALDDIAIPQLGYFDDAETDGGWTAAGFVRHSNVLPQSFSIQLLLLSEDEVRLEQLRLDENNQGQWQLPLNEQFNEAIVIISGTTPYTNRPAAYHYRVFLSP